jgi:hypothetical protein
MQEMVTKTDLAYEKIRRVDDPRTEEFRSIVRDVQAKIDQVADPAPRHPESSITGCRPPDDVHMESDGEVPAEDSCTAQDCNTEPQQRVQAQVY